MFNSIPDVRVTAKPVTYEGGGNRSGLDYELVVGESGFPSNHNIDNTSFYAYDYLTLEEMAESKINNISLLRIAALPLIEQFKIKQNKGFTILTDCPPPPEIKLKSDIKELTDKLRKVRAEYSSTYFQLTILHREKLAKEIKELDKQIHHKRNLVETMPTRKHQSNRFIAIQLNGLIRVLLGVNSGKVYYGVYQERINKWAVVRNPARIKSFIGVRPGPK